MEYFYRFKEQDGDWSPWNRCSKANYFRFSGMHDCETKTLSSMEEKDKTAIKDMLVVMDKDMLAKLKEMSEKATPGRWSSMADGNQYVNTGRIVDPTLVAAARIDGPKRPWNPHAATAFGITAKQHEEVRFVRADADFVCALVNWFRGIDP